jgi:FixJ family two-component response regulator
MDTFFDAPLTFHDLISVDSDDPAVKAMRKLDWELFMAGLDQRARTMIEWLVEGRTLKSLADHWRVSVTRVMQHKEKLLVRMREYFGEEMWLMLAEQPQWKNNLLAMRQWMACRHERMAF